MAELRHRFYIELKASYWHHFEEGLIMPKAVIILLESADRAIDHEQEEYNSWPYI